MEYFDAIHDSPSGIYHYALPFSPSSSWLREHYGSGLSQEVRVIKGLQAEWGTCSRIVSPNYVPLALTCWKDIVAVGLQGGDIIILDVFTGICKSVHSKHTSNVNSLAFSSDGVFFVSGSNDKTVKLWDTQTGGVVKTFCGHTHWVLSVAISCHRYDFLVCLYGTDLVFSNFLTFILHLGLITTPHVHMTYVYSFSHVSLFTRSHGQEKSLSYYDLLYDFGVLLYGRILTLTSFYFLHKTTTPKLPIDVDQRRPHLQKDTTRTPGMIIRKLSTVPRRTLVAPD